MEDMLFLTEPLLGFHHGQGMEDPRDGLTLFGPLDAGQPYGVRAGVVGTTTGIATFRDWVRRIQGPLADETTLPRQPYPGFEALFGIPWHSDPAIALEVAEHEIRATAFLDDSHQRVYETVNVYANRILGALRSEETQADVWFVIVPDFVYENCRPRSRVAAGLQVKAARRLNPRSARQLRTWPSFFEEENKVAPAYYYDIDFHNQLKARLLSHLVPTQVIRESTVSPPGSPLLAAGPKRGLRKLQATIAWNLTTTAFYKCGGRPWKLNSVRDGVCYVGLVFKQDDKHEDPRVACCAAQMFLDSGDGLVFRGAVGPWHTPSKNEFHLSRNAARQLVGMAVEGYRTKTGEPPKELFVHGKAFFSDDEWLGFRDAIDPSKTNMVGVRIQDENDFRLYRLGTHPVLRGLALVRNPKSAFLWTRGYTPRLKTYVGREVPRPLRVDILRGDAGLEVVLADIVSLTKLNYNACIFSDGLPVTLRFADAVGEILTAGPVSVDNPLPFKYYI